MLTANRSTQLLGGSTFILLIMLIVFSALFLVAQVTGSIAPRDGALTNAGTVHAVERHGTAALSAFNCINHPDAYQFFNNETDRVGWACKIEGRWAVAFTTKTGQRITAFFKEKLERLSQVTRYMGNTGYLP